MELKAHFTNIHVVIIGHLEGARSDIAVAIAWFTDRDIFEVLCKKARAGVNVSVALIGDEINQAPGGLNFKRLEAFGGHVTFLPPGSRDEPTMHHKFCVIDRSTVITGSYNWSRKARANDENITVVTDSLDFASNYLDVFDGLLVRAGKGVPLVVDNDEVRRRLEMIRNLILLGEQDDVAPHVRKLRSVAEALQISRIVSAIDTGQYKAVLVEIDAYLRRATALVQEGYANIPHLRFQLKTLELRLESLTDEKAELERRLVTFNRRHDDALGDIIQRVLRARSELAQLRAAERESGKDRDEAEATARDAKETFEEYARQHEELQRAEPLPMLDEESERELKAIFRKACSLCHPDKVTDDKKESAHHAFVELRDAYKRNDLPRVKEIYETLKAGGIPGTRSTALSESDGLRAAIAELEFAISRMVADLKALQASDSVRLMDTAGITETEWQGFFAKRREALDCELAKVVSDIQACLANELETYE
ncbi:phospholipase D-like domain-containing protein [Pseudomonas lundensis]|uniref:phospholipase D-like domain-containing protein n=1 Tax=Pseudomonas lundensis TaxID=86185 RepID=UPI00089DA89B|nr:phospholipase D-like domain-containing protein [Pseudomonas lundensis]